MELKRQPFRFRMPWISAASVPPAAAESSYRRPKKEPFRPSGIAPPQPHPAPSITKPQPQPPSTPSFSIQSPSPSTTQSRLNSSLSSPTTQSPSPTSTSDSTQSQQKVKSPLKSIPKSQEHNPQHTLCQPHKRSTQHAAKLGHKESSATTFTAAILKASPDTKKLETDTNGGSSKTSEEKGKVVMHKQPMKVGKAQDPLTGQQIRGTKPERHATGTQITRAEKKKQEVAETVERKMMFATSNPTGQDIKVVSSTDPATSNVSSMSPQKPPLPIAQKEIRQGISNRVDKLLTAHSTQTIDDENPFRIITLAGDNRGAIMHVGSNKKKERSIPIFRAYRKNPEESPEVSIDGEESSEEESDKSKKDEVGNAYVNSNAQSINNSFMLQSWVNERDPGVELILPQKPAEPVKCNDERGVETRKGEFNVCRNDRLGYQHRVRRRCLRGLFAETSESDPDNPDKPRRHGCKFKCGNT